MATECRKAVNRHRVKVIEAWIVLVVLFLVGGLIGGIIGRCSAPTKVETVVETVTKTVEVEVPTYDPGKLPEVAEITYFNVPLSHSLQRYIYEVCADEDVPVTLVMAMIEHESDFNPEEVSNTNDYGLMQINRINHDRLAEEYRTADMLNPYQNVFCGIKVIASYLEEYDRDINNALMAYNMGQYGAEKARLSGIEFTPYTQEVMALMAEYEQEVTENATGSLDE